ncbi:MAG: twin-arginine translocase subunit TatC [Verrucomicrobia bacterium]|nr:twin-arginine translocase subunit TatC [Verrucomicrobiota bacterium]
MDPEKDDSTLHPDSEEAGGGPVKSFLEHLEDLRWTLIKSIVTVLVAMLVCMIASDRIVTILRWPLDHPLSILSKLPPNQDVYLHLGTNHLGVIPASVLGVTNITTKSPPRSARLEPRQMGSNVVLTIIFDDAPVLPKSTPSLMTFGPVDAVMIALKIALYGGLILAMPFLIYFIGQFVLPALHVHEKKILYQAVGFGVGLFIAGVAFAYLVVTGVALMASVEFATWLGFTADQWRAQDYISFVTIFLLGMGACFEIPVVILVLVKIGLLDYKKLSKFRSYAIVINLIIGAVVTPSGDPFTMVLFAAPGSGIAATPRERWP